MFNAYLHAEQNSRLPWMSVWFGVDFTDIYLETYIKLNFELEQCQPKITVDVWGWSGDRDNILKKCEDGVEVGNPTKKAKNRYAQKYR